MIDADVAKAWGLLHPNLTIKRGDYYEHLDVWLATWKQTDGYEMVRRVPDPTEQPQAWLSALLISGRAIHIRPCGDGHLHFEIDSHEWVEYLGYENLGPATEAAVREWAKVAVR